MERTGLPATMESTEYIIRPDDQILVTGATGFIAPRLVDHLLDLGFRRIRCLVRHSSRAEKVDALCSRANGAIVEVMRGNLLSREDCARATENAAVIFHLAAGRGEKFFPDAFMNSVVTTRNLLDAVRLHQCLKRFVNVSSFAVYSNVNKPRWRTLDESCPVERHPELRADAYAFAKLKQDELVEEYRKKFAIASVIVRPGWVYGPGNESITGRVGTGTFGVFLHLGGSTRIPLTYVDNCAEAIARAGLIKGVDGNVFNIVDDDLPTSRQFLRLYKKNVHDFPSLFLPHLLSYTLCYLWEKYSKWSEGQLPSTFCRKTWHASWKTTRYTNAKVKQALGWAPRIPTSEGLARYFEAARRKVEHA